MEDREIEELKEDVKKKYAMTQDTFPQLEGEEAQFLRQFAFVCLLSYDVYVKKMIIEKMIDEMRKKESLPPKQEKKEKEKSESLSAFTITAE